MSSEATNIIITVVGAIIVAVIAFYLGWRYRQKIRNEVSKWLRRRNLDKSALMAAFILYDNVIAGIDRVRRKILVETVDTGRVEVSEQDISLEELRKISPDIYELVVQNGTATQDIYSLLS